MPANSKSFHLTVLGCSGGPIAGNTCSFLLKPASEKYTELLQSSISLPPNYISDSSATKDDCIILIDGGSILNALLQMFADNDLFINSLLALYPDSLKWPHYTNLRNMSVSSKSIVNTDRFTPLQLSYHFMNLISSILISHSHLDHTASLIINSPVFNSIKTIHGFHSTIESIQKDVFNNSLWPDLSSFFKFNQLYNDQIVHINKHFECRAFQVSHGEPVKATTISSSNHTANHDHNHNQSDNHLKQRLERCESSCFLIKNTLSEKYLLMFGDVESDLISKMEYNSKIWKAVSKLVIANKLNAIIIECSTVDKVLDENLFGHMSPNYLIYELLTLRKLCTNLSDDDAYSDDLRDLESQPLAGLNVIIIHVKETFDGHDPRRLILDELNQYNDLYNLQLNFSMGLPGLTYEL